MMNKAKHTAHLGDVTVDYTYKPGARHSDPFVEPDPPEIVVGSVKTSVVILGHEIELDVTLTPRLESVLASYLHTLHREAVPA